MSSGGAHTHSSPGAWRRGLRPWRAEISRHRSNLGGRPLRPNCWGVAARVRRTAQAPSGLRATGACRLALNVGKRTAESCSAVCSSGRPRRSSACSIDATHHAGALHVSLRDPGPCPPLFRLRSVPALGPRPNRRSEPGPSCDFPTTRFATFAPTDPLLRGTCGENRSASGTLPLRLGPTSKRIWRSGRQGSPAFPASIEARGGGESWSLPQGKR